MFGERAYDEVSIDDIARSAGIAKGLLYHYFPTKRGFYVAALRVAALQLLEATLKRDLTAKPEEQVRQALQTYFAFVARRGEAFVALMRGGIGSDAEVTEVLDDTRASFVTGIIDALPGDVSSPLLHSAIRGWVGFVEAIAIEWLRRRTLPVEQLAALSQAMLFDAIRAAGQISAPPRSRK